FGLLTPLLRDSIKLALSNSFFTFDNVVLLLIFNSFINSSFVKIKYTTRLPSIKSNHLFLRDSEDLSRNKDQAIFALFDMFIYLSFVKNTFGTRKNLCLYSSSSVT